MTEFNDDDNGPAFAMKVILLTLKWFACVLAAFIAVMWMAKGIAPWDLQ